MLPATGHRTLTFEGEELLLSVPGRASLGRLPVDVALA